MLFNGLCSYSSYRSGSLVAGIRHPAMTADTITEYIVSLDKEMVRREQSLCERPHSFSAGLRRFLPNPQSYGKIWCAGHKNDDIKEIPFLISFSGVTVSLVLLHHSLDLVSVFREA